MDTEYIYDMAQIKMGGGQSECRFANLSKTIRHMRARDMEGEYMALKLDEILDEINQLDVSRNIKRWFSTEVVKNTPKIDARKSCRETLD